MLNSNNKRQIKIMKTKQNPVFPCPSPHPYSHLRAMSPVKAIVGQDNDGSTA